MIIKCTSRTSKGMELNGNVLSGDTYNFREHIKNNWDGKWNAARKAWIVNPEKVVKTIAEKTWGMDRVLEISNEQPVAEGAKKSNYVSGWCNRCHSYCYGDCTA